MIGQLQSIKEIINSQQDNSQQNRKKMSLLLVNYPNKSQSTMKRKSVTSNNKNDSRYRNKH